MSENNFILNNVEEINNEIELSKNSCNLLKEELLKHYLINFILYLNDKESVDIKSELLKISVLLEKLNQMEKKLNFADGKRLVTLEMMKNKKSKKSVTSGEKFKNNYKKLQDKINNESNKKHKSNKFN